MAKKFFEYFPPPAYLEMPNVGLDLNPGAVRFIEMIKVGNGFQVGRFGERDLSAYNPNIPLAENKEVVDALRSLRKEYNLNYVEVALPEEKAYVYRTTIPAGSEAEIRSFLEFHLEENVPLSLEETIFDYHLVSDKEATVSVLPREVVEEYVELFHSVGLTPISFLVESQAMAKSVIKKGDNNTALILLIDDIRTAFSIVQDDSVMFTSSVNVGSDDFTKALMKKFNLSFAEAEKQKLEKGFTRDKENTELFFTLVSVAGAIKDELERVYKYWHTHTGQNETNIRRNIEKIYLLGKDSSIAGFKEFISESIRVETALGNVWTNAFSFENYIPPIEREDSLNYGVAIGLALPKL